MKRIILMAVRLFYIVPIWLFHIWRFSKDETYEKYNEQFRYTYLHNLVKRVNKAGRVIIDEYGKENLPKEDGYIMYPNHQGLFDSLVFFESHERPFSIVMKMETKDVFLLKQVRIAMKAKLMDRGDIRQSMTVIKEVSEEVKQGRNYIIFAEGTRSRNGNELLEFKHGSFKAATMAKSPIVPVALINSFVPFDSNTIKKTHVQIHYLKPLYYEDYKSMKTNEIATYVENAIRGEIRESLSKEC